MRSLRSEKTFSVRQLSLLSITIQIFAAMMSLLSFVVAASSAPQGVLKWLAVAFVCGLAMIVALYRLLLRFGSEEVGSNPGDALKEVDSDGDNSPKIN